MRVRAGDVIRARFTNQLPEPTTIHWRGIALRSDMDGVPGVSGIGATPEEALVRWSARPHP